MSSIDKLGNLATILEIVTGDLIDWFIDFCTDSLTNKSWKFSLLWSGCSRGNHLDFGDHPLKLAEFPFDPNLNLASCRICLSDSWHYLSQWVVIIYTAQTVVFVCKQVLKSFCSFSGTSWQGTSEEAGVKMISGTLMSQWPSKSNIEVHKVWIWFSFVVCREGWDLASETLQKKTG